MIVEKECFHVGVSQWFARIRLKYLIPRGLCVSVTKLGHTECGFIIELVPLMDWFYERFVGVVKRSLRKALSRRLLLLIQLQTLVKEIEAIVNTPPFVYIGDYINSNIILTQRPFLSLKPQTGNPLSDTSYMDSDYVSNEEIEIKLLNIW